MKLSQDRFWKINYLQNKKYPCISRHQYFRLEYLKQGKNNWKQVKNTKKCESLMFWKTFISGVPESSQTVHLLEDYFLSSLEGLTLWCWSSGSEKYSFDVRAKCLLRGGWARLYQYPSSGCTCYTKATLSLLMHATVALPCFHFPTLIKSKKRGPFYIPQDIKESQEHKSRSLELYGGEW